MLSPLSYYVTNYDPPRPADIKTHGNPKMSPVSPVLCSNSEDWVLKPVFGGKEGEARDSQLACAGGKKEESF